MSYDREQWLRQRAYAIWEAEGRPSGRNLEHWSQAERELFCDEATTPEAATLGTSIASSVKGRRAAPKPPGSTTRTRKKPLELRP
jgi:hypothetical protein